MSPPCSTQLELFPLRRTRWFSLQRFPSHTFLKRVSSSTLRVSVSIGISILYRVSENRHSRRHSSFRRAAQGERVRLIRATTSLPFLAPNGRTIRYSLALASVTTSPPILHENFLSLRSNTSTPVEFSDIFVHIRRNLTPFIIFSFSHRLPLDAFLVRCSARAVTGSHPRSTEILARASLHPCPPPFQ